MRLMEWLFLTDKVKRFVKIFEDEVFYITDTQNLKTLKDFRGEIALDCYGQAYEVETINKVALEEYNEYLYENSMTANEITNNLNEFWEENQRFKKAAIDLIKHYLKISDEQEGLLLGNAPDERAKAILELLSNLGLQEFLKENGIEVAYEH